jgi:hypothetical protein
MAATVVVTPRPRAWYRAGCAPSATSPTAGLTKKVTRRISTGQQFISIGSDRRIDAPRCRTRTCAPSGGGGALIAPGTSPAPKRRERPPGQSWPPMAPGRAWRESARWPCNRGEARGRGHAVRSGRPSTWPSMLAGLGASPGPGFDRDRRPHDDPMLAACVRAASGHLLGAGSGVARAFIDLEARPARVRIVVVCSRCRTCSSCLRTRRRTEAG